MSFESAFVNPMGRTSRGAFVGALVVLVAAFAFYTVLVKGRNADWCLVTLLFPAFVLLARRLHDMGRTAWLLVVPGALAGATMWMRLFSSNAPYGTALTWAALVVGAAFALWGLVGKGQAEANRFGEPAAA